MKIKNSENKQSVCNVLAIVIVNGIGFFSTPIFTRVLGTAEYGKYSVYLSWVLCITPLIGLSSHSSLSVAKYSFEGEYKKFRSSILLFGCLSCAVMCMVTLPLINVISMITGFPAWGVFFMLPFAFSKYVVEFAQIDLTYEKKAQINLLLSVIISVLSVGLAIYLLNTVDGVSKYILKVNGMAIPYLMIALLILWVYFFNSPPVYNKKYWKFAIAYGVPIVFHTLSQFLLGQSDRIMMSWLGIKESEIGIYSFFYTFTNVLLIVLNALNKAWVPYYYDDLNDSQYERITKKSRNYIEIYTLICCGFILMSREVCYLFAGEEYMTGNALIVMLTFMGFFTFMYQFPVNFEFFYKKTKFVAAGTVFSGLCNIVLNLILIPKWGMYGAGGATVLSYALLFVVHYFVATCVMKEPFHQNIVSFFPWIILLLAISASYFLLKIYWPVRWGLACLIGMYLLIKVYRRRSLF